MHSPHITATLKSYPINIRNVFTAYSLKLQSPQLPAAELTRRTHEQSLWLTFGSIPYRNLHDFWDFFSSLLNHHTKNTTDNNQRDKTWDPLISNLKDQKPTFITGLHLGPSDIIGRSITYCSAMPIAAHPGNLSPHQALYTTCQSVLTTKLAALRIVNCIHRFLTNTNAIPFIKHPSDRCIVIYRCR